MSVLTKEPVFEPPPGICNPAVDKTTALMTRSPESTEYVVTKNDNMFVMVMLPAPALPEQLAWAGLQIAA